jgi:SNF2 family DNA or RNA helicase
MGKEAGGEQVESRKGTLSVIEAFQEKMEEIIAVEENEEQKKILKKALERGLQALEGRK